jgi:tRNA pseudouridine55 synthase
VISGILPVDKPVGLTSHDVVARVRRAAGQKAVGHAGTLDPLATGLLLILLGDATKLSQYVMAGTKTYIACIVLGATTNTDDAEGAIACRAPLGGLSVTEIEAEIGRNIGEIDQVPPMYAAVRKDGVKLYTLARQGLEVEREPRRVRIDRIDLMGWAPPRLMVRVHCGTGTYIRSLARDIGAGLGVGGYLHALRRTRSGAFTAESAAQLDQLTDPDRVRASLQPADLALAGWPALVLDGETLRVLRQGQAITVADAPHGNLRVYGVDGSLHALCRVEKGLARPFRVLGGAAATA